jgi:hypothetical protein
MDQQAFKTMTEWFKIWQPHKWNSQGIIHTASDTGEFDCWLNPTADGAGWPVVLVSWYHAGLGTRWESERWTVETFADPAEAARVMVERVETFDRALRLRMEDVRLAWMQV